MILVSASGLNRTFLRWMSMGFDVAFADLSALRSEIVEEALDCEGVLGRLDSVAEEDTVDDVESVERRRVRSVGAGIWKYDNVSVEDVGNNGGGGSAFRQRCERSTVMRHTAYVMNELRIRVMACTIPDRDSSLLMMVGGRGVDCHQGCSPIGGGSGKVAGFGNISFWSWGRSSWGRSLWCCTTYCGSLAVSIRPGDDFV